MPLIGLSFWHGLRFDVATAVWLTLPFALWRILRAAPGRRERGLAFAIYALLALAGLFALIAEVEF